MPQSPDSQTSRLDGLPPEERARFLEDSNLAPANNFLNGTLWANYRKALRARMPVRCNAEEDSVTSSQRAFLRQGWEEVIEAIESLPYDAPSIIRPVIPETISETKD